MSVASKTSTIVVLLGGGLVRGLRAQLNALYLQELQTTKERVGFQLEQLFPQGHFVLDVVENGKVGMTIALPTGQLVIDQGCRGDNILAWVKTRSNKGELCIAFVYGDRRRQKHVALWNWMERNLPIGNWLICGDFNHIEFVDDLVGPNPLFHGLECHAWNHLIDKLDLFDNRLIAIIKIDPHFTRQTTHGGHFDQSDLDHSYSSNKGL